jgi:hypothetical protein
MAFSQKFVNGETLTKENFKNPPKELGILPFWFWNGDMDEKEMEWQMREYKSKGIPGFFIHGRFGEKIGYLSDTWFERTKFAVEKAKEIGIDVWIYDEMNWPSGTAERQVPKKNPHLRQKYLELVPLMVQGPLFTFLEATDDRYVNTGDSKPIAAFACTDEEYHTGIKNLIDLTPNLSFNAVIPWEAPEGNWRLLYFLEKEIDYYIDALNPESTKRFLEVTHDGYKKAVGKDFGSIVPGFFTDEPAMHYYHVGLDNLVVPWSSQMFKIFRERRGYDLKPYLPALYASMGKITSKIRFDFWRTLTEQYSDSYYKQIREWCEENDVLFTGHLLGEEWLRMHSRCEGNIFKHLKHLHITGVDHLYPKIGTDDTPDQHVALKLASSAAHHFGSTRLLCESMGGTYWDCTLERMKWIANWEYVLGVTIFNNHGYHYSIEGERKRDWPPSQFYHHTWWKHYDYFTEYMARLGHILSGGKHVAKILILYPINSIWTNYIPQSRNDIGNVIESDFNYLTHNLLKLHYDFDYVDEDILSEAKVEKGKIKINEEEFSVLILPPITHLQKNAFDVIERFIKSGGKVIADTLLPVEILDYEKKDSVKKIEKLFGTNPEKLLHSFSNGVKFQVAHKNTKGDVFVIKGKGLHKEKKKNELKKILSKCITPDVTISNEDIFYLHRVKDNFDIYFFVNTQQVDNGKVEITFEKVGKPELWNANTGKIEPINIYKIKNNRLSIELNFPPTESHIVIIGDKINDTYVTETNLTIEEFDGETLSCYSSGDEENVYAKIKEGNKSKIIKQKRKKALKPVNLPKQYSFNIEDDNVLCLSKWKMKLAEENESDIFYEEEYDDSSWLSVTNGAWEMQLPQERDKEDYPVTLWYRTSFEVENLPSNTLLLIDGFSGSDYQLFINGKEIKDKGKRSKLDAEIKEVDIQSFVQKGYNVVAVKLIAKRRTDGILDLLKIIGDFALEKSGDNYRIVEKKTSIKLGDWTEQGYPFYSGTGVYETEVNIKENYLDGKLFLSADCGEDVLEVIINDNDGIVVPWHPYKVDITGLVKPGKNKIKLKVTNTLINILEAVQKKSGIFSQPKIEHANKYELVID